MHAAVLFGRLRQAGLVNFLRGEITADSPGFEKKIFQNVFKLFAASSAMFTNYERVILSPLRRI
jgi:hypothetical protein